MREQKSLIGKGDLISKHILFQVVRSTIIDLVPIFIIGLISNASCSIILMLTPGTGISDNVRWLYFALHYLNSVTYGMITLYAIFFSCKHFFTSRMEMDKKYGLVVTIVASDVMSFALPFLMNAIRDPIVGHSSEFPNIADNVVKTNVNIGVMGPKGLVLATVVLCISFYVFGFVYDFVSDRVFGKLKSMWTDNNSKYFVSLYSAIPIVISLLIIMAFNLLIVRGTGSESMYGLAEKIYVGALIYTPTIVLKQLLLIASSSVFWVFGVHGAVFIEDGLAILAQNTEGALRDMFSIGFIQSFVLIGGCGGTISLAIAIWICAKKKKIKISVWHKLAGTLTIFNINEFVIFGTPIIFNKLFAIPFILTPLVSYGISVLIFSTGAVEFTGTSMSWFAPVLVNGYLATNSFMGVLLQLFNIGVGTLIYFPFAYKHMENLVKAKSDNYQRLIKSMKSSELQNTTLEIMSPYSEHSVTARELDKMLRKAISSNNISLFYQPQYDDGGRCIGAEALLRMKHPVYGYVYPPILVQIASEDDVLMDLEKAVMIQVFKDVELFKKNESMRGITTSVNVSGSTIVQDSFEEFLYGLSTKYDIEDMHICIEVTERDALGFSDEMLRRFERIRAMGYKIALDDFSMGNTSLHYLTKNYFDIIKLDGSLVRDVIKNDRSRDIISSIVSLSENLKLDVVAEFVSSSEVRDVLLSIGCRKYQGYLFSPAVSRDEYISRCKDISKG